CLALGSWLWAFGFALRRLRHPLHREDFDDVADLDVVEALERDAALETRLDLADVFLEAAERSDLALPGDDVVAEQAGLGVAAAPDRALEDRAAGDHADLRRLEDLPHLGRAEPRLLER